MLRFALTVLIALAALGCSRAREYELRGQVLAVDAGRRTLTIKHEDIRGFMPAMTMAFAVRDERLMRGREAGELIRATLVVEDTEAHLSSIERTGFARVDAAVPPPPPAVLSAGDAVPDAQLVDQHAKPRRMSDWRGRAVAVAFTYTRCPLPTFCPMLDRRFGEAQRMVAADPALREGTHLLSISFDPAHDTPAVLAAHAARVAADPAHWTYLTGTREEVDRLASAFGVSTIRGSAPADEIVHNLRTAVVDPQGRLVTVLPGAEWSAAELVDHLRKARGAAAR